MNSNKYLPVSVAMYSNYVSHGMGLIILMQTSSFLMQKLNTDLVGISWVVSMMAVGKIIVLAFSGVLSDKFGRKPFVMLGIASYSVFFLAIPFCPSIQVAAFVAMFAGAGNSFMDTGSMPAWMEAYPKATGSVTILQKAAVSIGQFLFPIILGFYVSRNMSMQYVYLTAFGLLMLNALVIWRTPFPPMPTKENKVDTEAKAGANSPLFAAQPKLMLEGACLVLIGFTSTSTFTIHSNWMSLYAQTYAGASPTSGSYLLSLYSTASIVAVILTSIAIKKFIKAPRFLVLYPAISVISLLVMVLNPSFTVCRIVAVLVGFTAAGGVLQLTVATMADLFPMGKGKVTSVVYMTCSICMLVVPTICGYISKTGIANVMLFNVAVTTFGVILGIIVNIRYNIVFGIKNKR